MAYCELDNSPPGRNQASNVHGRHFACAVAFVCARRRPCCFCVHTERCGTGLAMCTGLSIGTVRP